MSNLLLSLAGEVTLNEYGRIIHQTEHITAEYIYEDQEYYIYLDDLKLVGNVLYPLQLGYLTLVTEHENLPTWLRLYDENGTLLSYKKLPKVINLTLSQNRRFAAFFTGDFLQVLDTATADILSYDASVQFAVDNSGIALYSDLSNCVHYRDSEYAVSGMIRTVLFQNDIPLIITKHDVYKIDDTLQKIKSYEEEIFQAKIIENSLYLVLKKNSNFSLHRFMHSQRSEVINEIKFERESNRIHEPIYAPLNYGEEDYPFQIGNSYGEIQQYGTDPYLHPGVDFLGDDFQEVYAVHDGFVKAVLTTGGAPYWRVAISNEDTSAETQGYLYAHLNDSSITVNIGDEVQAGDLLGTLYPWNYYDFTHIHFARIKDEGNFWTGAWWTVDNPLVDVINIQDSIPPVFENALGEDKFAFRTADGEYLSPFSLQGEFDIIVKCHDLCNSDWRIDVWDISFSLHSHNSPDSTLYELFSYKYDMLLDHYFGNYYTNLALNTIYSQDAVCPSVGNYEMRDYYHIITNSDGDSLITENDEPQIFDSSQFADGMYFFKVRVRDASLNTTVDSMMIYFDNGVSAGNDLPEQEISLTNYPNPFNPSTTISFSLTTEITEDTELVIYNLKGQKVRTLDCCNSFAANARDSRSTYSVIWNGTDDNNQPVSSGIYLYKLKTGSFEKTNKMVLMK